jgi:cytochrome oxidase Cu insertion factor (SCO1/SenC/PrrC family)
MKFTRRHALMFGSALLPISNAARAQSLPFRATRARAASARLRGHRGETLDWRADIIEARRRAFVGFTYVGCATQCPASDLLLQQVDAAAAPEIALYTLTLSPLTDDWRRMATKAEDMSATARWTWLSGEPREVYALLEALEVAAGTLESHGQALLRVGFGRCERVDDLPSLERVLASA